MTELENRFLCNVATAAIACAHTTGVPASITIAQAILESGWGQSQLALKANNYFGVKAVGNEDYAEFNTTEFVKGIRRKVLAKFARYPSPIESFAHHGLLLSRLTRYAPAMAVASDPDKFAHALYACGYSTLPEYGDRLMQLVREFNLTQYDIQPPTDTPQQASLSGDPVDPAQAKEVAA